MKQLSLLHRADIEEDVPLNGNIIYLKKTDQTSLLTLKARLLSCEEIAVDIETYGDNKRDGLRWWKGKIRLLQFGFREGITFILDWLHLPSAEKQSILPAIKQALESTRVVKLMQNGKFDCCFFIGQLDIHPRNIRDSWLLSNLIYAGIKQYRHDLRAIVERELAQTVDKTEQKNDWSEPRLLNKQLNYSAKDVQILFPLIDALKARIGQRSLTVQAKIECGVMPVIAEMECNGFPVEIKRVKQCLGQHLELAKVQIDIFKKKFPTLAITASSQTLQPLLNSTYAISLESTEDSELSKYKHIPVIAAIATYRSVKKQIDYLKGILVNERNGRVYTKFTQVNPAGFGRTASGKLDKHSNASDGLNFQNVPNPLDKNLLPPGFELIEIKSCFRATKDRVLLVNDAASAHGRIATEASQDPRSLEIYNNGLDLHLVTAVNLAKLKGYSWDYEFMVTAIDDPAHPDHSDVKQLRSLAKPVHFGSQNLQGGYGLQQRIRQDGIEVLLELATASSKGWRNTYAGIYAKQLALIEEANQVNHRHPGIDADFGMTVSLSGRSLWMQKYPDKYNDSGFGVKGSDCVSFQWTATESDIMKLAMIRVQQDFDEHPEWNAKLINLCHDELDGDSDRNHALPAASSIFTRMNNAMATWIKSIPVNESSATPEDCIKNSWADK